MGKESETLRMFAIGSHWDPSLEFLFELDPSEPGWGVLVVSLGGERPAPVQSASWGSRALLLTHS